MKKIKLKQRRKKTKQVQCIGEIMLAKIDWSGCNPEIVKMIDKKMNAEGEIEGDIVSLGQLGRVLLEIYDEGQKWYQILSD